MINVATNECAHAVMTHALQNIVAIVLQFVRKLFHADVEIFLAMEKIMENGVPMRNVLVVVKQRLMKEHVLAHANVQTLEKLRALIVLKAIVVLNANLITIVLETIVAIIQVANVFLVVLPPLKLPPLKLPPLKLPPLKLPPLKLPPLKLPPPLPLLRIVIIGMDGIVMET
ncbi:MAG: hypothetical protein QXD89_01415 [Candidatus Aenigmatarchaeota archaeon]